MKCLEKTNPYKESLDIFLTFNQLTIIAAKIENNNNKMKILVPSINNSKSNTKIIYLHR